MQIRTAPQQKPPSTPPKPPQQGPSEQAQDRIDWSDIGRATLIGAGVGAGISTAGALGGALGGKGTGVAIAAIGTGGATGAISAFKSYNANYGLPSSDTLVEIAGVAGALVGGGGGALGGFLGAQFGGWGIVGATALGAAGGAGYEYLAQQAGS